MAQEKLKFEVLLEQLKIIILAEYFFYENLKIEVVLG